MKIWSLNIRFVTDGDFGWHFAPIDMEHDEDYLTYTLNICRKIADAQDEQCARNEFSSILNFLINNIQGRDYTVEYVKEQLLVALRYMWDQDFHCILDGNYVGSYIDFCTYAPVKTFKIGCTDEEYEKLKAKFGENNERMIKKLLED